MNNYAGCSTGQQWDGISYRVFGKQLPIFNISHPFLWGNKPDAGYLTRRGVGGGVAASSRASCAS